METNNLETDNLISSENFNASSIENSTELNRQVTDFLKNASRNKAETSNDNKSKQLVKKEQDVLGLVESSSIELSSFNLNNDIINGIKDFEFETNLEKCHFPSRKIFCKNLRRKCHAQIVTACAHAVYFVGVANRIRRNIDEIRSGSMRQKNSMLLNEMKKTPGLQIGIIGCGKLGYQLARSFLEYSEVYPNELQISTRQPELLKELLVKNVRCYFDNRRLINSVNIVFICVLPSQIEQVIKDIKDSLPEKCIIYSLVRPQTAIQLKNLFNDGLVQSFIMRPEFEFTDNFKNSFINWNYTQDILESFTNNEMYNSINPFLNEDDSILTMNNRTRATFVYAIINTCSFLNLGKQDTLNALRNYVFYPIGKNFKIEESLFYENKNVSMHLPIVDLVETANKPTEFSSKLDSHKSLRKSLGKSFTVYFEEANAWKARHTLKS